MPKPFDTTLIVEGDTALDLWNATGQGEEIVYLTYGNEKTIAARVTEQNPTVVEDTPVLEVELQKVKDRPSHA